MIDTKTKDTFILDSLVLKREYGYLNFIHLTYPEYIEPILKYGFEAGEGNLGEGVYCANLNDYHSIESLRRFAVSGGSMYEGEEKVAIILGKYSGKYIKCIDSKEEVFMYNRGFYLLEDVECISDLYATIIDVSQLKSYMINLEKKAINKKFLLNI